MGRKIPGILAKWTWIETEKRKEYVDLHAKFSMDECAEFERCNSDSWCTNVQKWVK